MDQIIQLIHETAKQIAAHNEKKQDAGWLIDNKTLNDEIDTYLKIYKQIAIMKASKELKNG
jgi:hypothetical protein